MSTWRSFLRGGLFVAAVLAVGSALAQDASSQATESDAPSSEQIEKDLQSLSWQQFRAVVEAVPKLKADIEAYGPLGWSYVEANYTHYRWKKSVDKLDATNKSRLAGLIENARSQHD